MLSAGHMVTRGQMDSWCEKRPDYAASSISEKKCLNAGSMTANYYVNCSEIGGKMPTYDKLIKIRFAQISFKNNDDQSRNIRVGFRVFGSSDSITWFEYHSIGIDESYTFNIEGIASATSYAVYIQESTNSQDLFSFVNGTYISTLSGYGYIQSTLISGTEQKSTQFIQIYVSSMKISLCVKCDNKAIDVRVWGSVYDQNAQDTTNHTFENIPFGETFSITVNGVNAAPGYEIGAYCSPQPYEFDPMYLDNAECEYEFNTGTTIITNHYEVTVLIP